MINTTPVDLLSGTWWVEIDTTNNGNTKIKKLGALTYELDMKPDNTAITTIQQRVGVMTVDLWDATDNGESTYNIIDTEIGTVSSLGEFDILHARLRRQYSNGLVFDTPFLFDISSVKFDPIKDIISVRLRADSDSNTYTMGQYFAQTSNVVFYPNSELLTNAATGGFNAVAAGDFVFDMVKGLDPTAKSNVALPSAIPFTGITPRTYTNLADLTESVNCAIITSDDLGNGKRSYELLKSLALIDGAYYGTAFGVNYYVGKNRTELNTTISNNDMEKFTWAKQTRTLNTFTLNFAVGGLIDDTTNMPRLTESSVLSQQLSINGTDKVDLSYTNHYPHLSQAKYNTASNQFNIPYLGSDDFTWQNIALQRAGGRVYQRAYNAPTPGNPSTAIEFTVLDIDKIHPSNTVRFGSDTPSVLQGKDFRPQKIVYDLEEDKISVTAYQL